VPSNLRLSNSTLRALPAAVRAPHYERPAALAGIVHVGIGRFFRAHLCMYVDELRRNGTGPEWGILGIGMRASSEKAELGEQDYLYTLTEKARNEPWRSTVIGSLTGHLNGHADPRTAVNRVADPRTKILSLTITEGGYNLDANSGEFLSHVPAVERELQDNEAPSTVFGLLYEACRLRRGEGTRGLTVLSCDNLQNNGQAARRAFVGYADLRDPDIARWMEDNVSFPDSMVDRVTPAGHLRDGLYLQSEYGYDDKAPVTAEPFHQWVIEDDFAAGRPPFEEAAGVTLTKDVTPYELMKLLLANGTHQVVSYFGTLLGYKYVHEALADPDIRNVALRYIDLEAGPILRPIPGIEARSYGRVVLDRFSNEEIQDELARICAYASDRIPKFVLPVARAQTSQSGPVKICAAVVAGWARYAAGRTETGAALAIIDTKREFVVALAQAALSDPILFVRNEEVFGDLSHDQEFIRQYLQAAKTLERSGVRSLLRALAEE
jgi:mannitol 2-dehydrogenase